MSSLWASVTRKISMCCDVVLSLGCWGISALVPEEPSPLTLVFPVLFLTFFSPSSSASPVFSTLSYRCFHRGTPDSPDGLSCVCVSTGELTEAGCVQHQAAPNLFSQRSPLQRSWQIQPPQWHIYGFTTSSFPVPFFSPGSCGNSAMKTGRACDGSSNIQQEKQWKRHLLYVPEAW